MEHLVDLTTRRISRRGLLRSSAIAATGLAGAALIGCSSGSEGDSDGSAPATAGPAPSGGGTATASATTPAAGQPKRGGILTVDSGAPNPNVLLFGFNIRNRPIQHTVWEQLIGLTANYEIKNVLAETFEMKPDSTGAHVVLRQGVEFHNGRPLTAEDVAFSIDFFSNKESSGQLKGPLSKGIAEVKVVDDHTLDIDFKGPQPILIDMFGLMRIVDKDTIAGTPEMQVLNGTGPFKFVSFTPDVGYRLERNENYWQPELPYLDGIEGKVYADSAARELAIRTGELLWTDGVSYPGVAAFQGDDNVVTASRGKSGHHHLGLVTDKPPFDHLKARQALTFAIDRQRLSDEWAEGVVAPTVLPWPVESSSYDASQDVPNLVKYDPDRAKSLLEEAGAVGTHITIQVGSSDEAVGMAQYLQDDLNAVGFDTEIVILEPSVALDQLRKREIQSNAWLGVHGFANYAHPGSAMNAAQQYQVPNASHYEPAGYTDLLAKLSAAPLGSPELHDLVREWNQQHAIDNPWVIGLLASDQYRAMNAKVKGDHGGNLSVLQSNFAEWWLDA